MELKVQTDGLPEEMDDMVSVEKSSGESAYGLTIISGQGVYYPFAYDVNGDIRWYLNHRTSTYGVFQLSNGNYIMQDNYGYVSSVTKSFPCRFFMKWIILDVLFRCTLSHMERTMRSLKRNQMGIF